MKKSNFEGKLSLNKETLASLNQEKMNQLMGGHVACDPDDHKHKHHHHHGHHGHHTKVDCKH